MRKDTLWIIVVQQNPEFETGTTAFSPKGLRKFFDLAWEEGHKQGVANGRALGASTAKPSSFEQMFPWLTMGK